jgi:hypothetical protein
VHLLLRDHEPACLVDGGADRRKIERSKPAQVDDLGVDALSRELLGGRQRALHHQEGRDDRDVTSGTDHRGLAELGNLAAHDRSLSTVQALVLVEEGRVGVVDGRAEQAVCRPWR